MKLIRRKFFSHDLYFLQEIPHRYMSVSLIQVIVISAYWFYCLTTFASQNGDAVLEKHELIYRLALMAAPMPVILYLTYFAVNFLCRFLHFQTTVHTNTTFSTNPGRTPGWRSLSCSARSGSAMEACTASSACARRQRAGRAPSS